MTSRDAGMYCKAVGLSVGNIPNKGAWGISRVSWNREEYAGCRGTMHNMEQTLYIMIYIEQMVTLEQRLI
jgi:hypothetical protein